MARRTDEGLADLEHLQLALEAGRLGTWRWDAPTGEVVWDDTLEAMFGFEPGGFPGTFEAYAERLHPDDREFVLETIRRSMASGRGHEFEHRVVWPDGTVRWIEGRGRVVADVEGRACGMAGVAVDITDRKRLEQRREAQYEVARVLAEASSVDEAAPRLLDAACRTLDFDVGELWQVSRSERRLRCTAFRRADWMPADTEFERQTLELSLAPGEGTPGTAWERREPIWMRTGEAGSGPAFRRLPSARRLGLTTNLQVPIIVGDRVLGVAGFLSRDEREPDPDLMRLMRALGSQVAQFIERVTSEAALRASESRERRSRDRAVFLAEVSAELARSLDQETTLSRVAELVVPRVADWCSVEVVREDGSIQHLAVAHADPEKVRLARELRERYPADPDAPNGTAAVIRSGTAELIPVIGDEMLDAAARDEDHRALLDRLGIRSYMCVPLTARGRTLGALTFVNEDLSRPFTDEDLTFAEELARRAAMAIDNARLFQQRSHTARTLQRSLLPARLAEVPGFEVAARHRPAGEGMEVGGDFYDLFEIGDGRWVATIGDVCGKGADAAALTALARHTIRAVARRGVPPIEVLSALNEAILAEHGDERFCTVAYGQLSLADTPRLSVVTAGHPLPFLVRASGEVEEVGVPGMLLGLFADIDLHAVEQKLAPGEAFVLFTDGITEGRSAAGDQFGEERLRMVLAEASGGTANELAGALDRAVHAHAPERPRDDVAILVLRRTR
jgi:PAS domain S-box-containing protein